MYKWGSIDNAGIQFSNECHQIDNHELVAE